MSRAEPAPRPTGTGPARRLMAGARALVVFDAAARAGSFTAAGAELGLSQGAVSLHVRNLEDQLGLRLFHRDRRRVRLTEAGKRLAADVALGLGHIRKSVAELQAQADDRHVTISASSAFSSYWMLPRLARFRQDLPDIDLRIQSSERDLDLAAETIPLGIRMAPVGQDWPDDHAAVLAAERIEAVASPLYARTYGLPASAAEIARHRLIHLEEPYRPCVDWTDWLAGVGAAPPPAAGAVSVRAADHGLLINDYVLVIQAVLEGQGIALGWKHLTDRMVESGLLLRAGDAVLETGNAVHVVWSRHRPLSATAARVRDWLVAEGRPDGG